MSKASKKPKRSYVTISGEAIEVEGIYEIKYFAGGPVMIRIYTRDEMLKDRDKFRKLVSTKGNNLYPFTAAKKKITDYYEYIAIIYDTMNEEDFDQKLFDISEDEFEIIMEEINAESNNKPDSTTIGTSLHTVN